MDTPLNITNDQKDDQDFDDPNLEKEFQDFMKNMQQGETGELGAGMPEQFGALFKDLLNGMKGGEDGDVNE